MAVPFRRTGKTAKRKRRTHFKLQRRVTPECGYYKGQLVLKPKKKEDQSKEK